jgi:16S rRNA (adenine1518-N6/adenine1519-N6)-dimethyltransferase
MQEHKARRRFGQNFLVDNQIIQRILDSIAPQHDQHVVEIGPGLGALTEGLAEASGQLTLVELDRDLFARLEQRFGTEERVKLVQGDALKVDFYDIAASHSRQRLRLVGNLPYNISTPLMFHFFEHAAVVDDMTFMLQREVALRLLAAPGSANYGRLSVMTQFHCHGHLVVEAPPEAFNPAPKVHSAVVRLIPHTPPLEAPEAQRCFADIVRDAFSQRRKTLRNSLRRRLSAEHIEQAGINPGERPEKLSVENFVQLTQVALQQG